MTAEVLCPACKGNRTVLAGEAKRNERRLRNGQRPVMAEIERVKRRITDCAAAGHSTHRKQEAAAAGSP